MEDQTLVRIDSKLARELRVFCRMSGVSISTVLNEAISEWIECGRLIHPLEVKRENILKRIEMNGSKVRLTQGEQELMARWLPQNDPEPEELKDGKPVMCFHLHDEDPVPVEWRDGKDHTVVKKSDIPPGKPKRASFQTEVK